MPVINHALLGVSVVALAAAGMRLASPLAERGPARAIAAAAFATALAVAEAIVLGLASLGGSTVALTGAALATAAATLAWLPRPAFPVGDEALGWWRARTPIERAGAGAIGGAALAWAAWQLRHPAIGFDSLHYHLPEMVIFVQGGRPGSIHDVLPGLPVGNYPLATEVTIGWCMAISRSFVPLVLWPWFTLALTAASAWAGLRALGAGRPAAGLAAAALCTSPWLLGWQSNGSVTDPPALAWLVACAALCALSRERPALMAAAVVAGGLAIGCKTTSLPYTVVVLAVGLLWGGRVRRLPLRPLALGTALALLVGGLWYLRNLVTHGSPFWPIVAAPWGDPVPHSVEAIQTSLLDRPRATIDVLGGAYLDRFGGAVLLMAAGVLAPLAAPRRRVVAAAVAALAGLLLWARSPITGIPLANVLPETVFSTTRYLLPVVAAACLALALAATDGRRLRAIAPLVILAAATVMNLVQAFRLGFPVAPTALPPATGALVGAVVASLAGLRAWTSGRVRLPASPSRRAAVAFGIAIAGGALLAVPAHDFLRRHADSTAGDAALAARRLAADPEYRDGESPLATTPAYIGVLAGDRLRHRLEAIPPGESCAALARRAQSQWLVIYGGPLGGKAPADVTRCLSHPLYDHGTIVVYPPAAEAAGR